jgi:hypothetical protein
MGASNKNDPRKDQPPVPEPPPATPEPPPVTPEPVEVPGLITGDENGEPIDTGEEKEKRDEADR